MRSIKLPGCYPVHVSTCALGSNTHGPRFTQKMWGFSPVRAACTKGNSGWNLWLYLAGRAYMLSLVVVRRL